MSMTEQQLKRLDTIEKDLAELTKNMSLTLSLIESLQKDTTKKMDAKIASLTEVLATEMGSNLSGLSKKLSVVENRDDVSRYHLAAESLRSIVYRWAHAE